MSNEVTIWEQSRFIDPIDEIIKRGDTEGNYDLIMAQIPAMFGDSDKATYLGFRALGFRPKQTLELLQLPEATLEIWKEETPELEDFEYKRLPELQSRINADIIRLQFMRNMTLFLFQDSRTIAKSLGDINEMSNREFNYLRVIRRFYGNNDLLALQKAMEPEKHRNNTLLLSFNNTQFEVVENGEETNLREIIHVDES